MNCLYAIPYTPKTNAIENWFSQLKHYLKKNGVLNYRDLHRSCCNIHNLFFILPSLTHVDLYIYIFYFDKNV